MNVNLRNDEKFGELLVEYATAFSNISGALDPENLIKHIEGLYSLVGASTVLTDERIKDIWRDTACIVGEGTREHPAAFARAIEREVAAQAGQVAVPDFRNVTEVKRISDQSLTITFASCASCSKFERAAAPSPAKESK
jgi:hypothetical protein